MNGADEAVVPIVPGRDVLRAVVLAVLVITGLGIVYATPLRDLFSTAGIDRVSARVDQLGLWAPIAFFAICAAAIAIGVPRLFFAAVAGATFGFGVGLPLALAATLTGCVITFLYARWLGQAYIRHKLGSKFTMLGRLIDRLGDHGIAGNLLIRAAPVGNCLVANLIMAVSPISMRDFLIGTILGILPETLIYSLLGSSAHGHVVTRIVSGAFLLVALSIGYWIYTRRSALAREVAAAPMKELA